MNCPHRCFRFSSFIVLVILAFWPSLSVAQQAQETSKEAAETEENRDRLDVALDELRDELKQKGKKEFLLLLKPELVQAGIKKALTSYEKLHANNPDKNLEYFEIVIKPLFESIADSRVWPPFAEFSAFYGLTDQNGVKYEGLGVRLQVRTPGENAMGFSLPVVDVWYGRFQ
jgi:hypothetical protein